jgi:hypothetical protein
MQTYTLDAIYVADHDDCLAAAREMAARQSGADLCEIDAEWGDDDRETVRIDCFESLSAPFVAA